MAHLAYTPQLGSKKKKVRMGLEGVWRECEGMEGGLGMRGLKYNWGGGWGGAEEWLEDDGEMGDGRWEMGR